MGTGEAQLALCPGKDFSAVFQSGELRLSFSCEDSVLCPASPCLALGWTGMGKTLFLTCDRSLLPAHSGAVGSLLFRDAT